MIMKKWIIVLFFISHPVFSQQIINPLDANDLEKQNRWVDSLYNQMTVQEKVGQLFMVAAYSNRDSTHTKLIDSLIIKHRIGGLIFFQGGPVRQALMTNRYQAESKIPLMIGIDAEFGLNMRLDSTFRYPWNMTLGAIRDKNLIRQVGEQLGRQSKRMGIHINFAPVLDINTNPSNPIIGNRSYGENKKNVYQSASAFIGGMHSEGILSSGKHFPGHGDTDTDSHKTLPIVNHNLARLDSVEFYPYKKLFSEGLSSVMVAHLEVPDLEPRTGYPSSISYNIITSLLKDKMGFKGLIFTDALNMKGASTFSSPGDIDFAAFLAGNDVLLFSEDVPTAAGKLIAAYENGSYTEERLAYSVKKILKAKYKAGLHHLQKIDTANLIADLNKNENKVLDQKLYENAITLLKNKKEILPIKDLQETKIAYLKVGDDNNDVFVNTLKKYTDIDVLKVDSLSEDLDTLKPYDLIIIGYHKSNASAYRKNDFAKSELTFINKIAQSKKVILAVFARPYVLMNLKDTKNIEGLVMAYQNSEMSQSVTAQAIFGAIGFKGILPVSVSEEFKEGSGLKTQSLSRLAYAFPESVGLNATILNKIDVLAQYAIDQKITPGMQVLVARKGKVVYSKNFGFYTYEKTELVTDSTLYDLASLTKILATLPMVMKLYENKDISFDTKLGELLPELKNSNKKNITTLEILSHYGKLKPWIPFYLATLNPDKTPSDKYYRKAAEGKFNMKIANDLYMREDYKDTMYQLIADSPLQPKLEYKYSDLPFLIMKKYIEKEYGKHLEDLDQKYFYEGLGANYTTFRPLEKFPLSQITPTENDNYFRHQIIRGYVHDMGAAMLNGVGGHAGLFSNANDVAKIMQMYLQNGYYGGQQFLETSTMGAFNSCYYCNKNNRRGIGFDKPQLGGEGPTCGCVSMKSFGHSGFTGTFAWADPEVEIVYIFMSNRTYPDSAINKLSKESIRERIQQIIYDAIFE